MSDPYESDAVLNQYLLFHFGSPEEIAPPPGAPPKALDFPARTAALAVPKIAGRALDIGCAVGRSTFELSKTCDRVVGIDYSQSFIDAATRLSAGEKIPYRRHDEGNLTSDLVADLPASSRPENITFLQGDAMNLPPDLGAFDLVHAANLLCRLPEPRKFLARLPSLVAPGGRLLLATPCTWLPEYTPRENWPPGTTLDYLHEHLDPAFALESVDELPFLIREHSRKFQLSTSQVSIWKRRPTDCAGS